MFLKYTGLYQILKINDRIHQCRLTLIQYSQSLEKKFKHMAWQINAIVKDSNSRIAFLNLRIEFILT